MKKKNWTIITLLCLTAASAVSFISASVAWIVDANQITMNETAGYTQGAYFARGSGTETDPYILNAPIHLYNLAWLQDMGKFNTPDDSGNVATVYFKMEADLDMSATEYQKLPPIGTTTYPFVGNFDGDGHTISGLTTCNKLGSGDKEIIRKPSMVTSLNDANIMGVFGVVGSYNNNPADGKYSSSANEISDLKIKNYTIASSSSNLLCGAVAGYVNGKITDVAVSNADSGITFDVASGTTKLGTFNNISDFGLVGYATSQYTKEIGDETINIYNTHVEQEETAYVFAGSDEGWGGTISMMEIYKRLETYNNQTSNKTNLPYKTDRIKTKTTTKTNGVITNTDITYHTDTSLFNSFKQWQDQNYPLRGKAVFHSAGQFLWGSVDDTRTAYKETEIIKTSRTETETRTCIISGSNYLTVSKTIGYSVGKDTNLSNSASIKEDANGYLYTEVDGNNVYLYTTSALRNGTSLSASTQNPTSNDGRYYLKKSGTSIVVYRNNTQQTSIYFKYNNGFKIYNRNSGTATSINTMTITNTIDDPDVTNVIEDDSNYYPIEKVGKSYLPLNVYESDTIPDKDMNTFWNDRELVPEAQAVGQYCPIPTNTAYIVGGTVDINDDWGCGLRFKEFGNYTPFQRTMNNSASYATNSNNLQIITRTPETDGFTFIEDQYNKDSDLNSCVDFSQYMDHIPVDNRVRYTYDDLGLERYFDSRTALDNLCKANTKSWYMRFNGHNISTSNVIEADSVVLNKHYYTNYQLPESTIDFRVAERGVINMFSSGFRTDSEGGECKGFCSLYHVFRNSSQNITNFKRIKEIYTSPNDDSVVYRYFATTTTDEVEDKYFKYTATVDPNTNLITSEGYVESSSLPSGYELTFDLDWLENPGFTKSHAACYYFEWPVSPGEYAIGSIHGGRKTAYMCYLDVGASSKKSKRTSVYVKYTVETNEYTIATGVYFISELAEEINNNKTLSFTLIPGFDGTLTMSGSSTLTELSRYDDYTKLNYKDYDMIFKKSGEDPPINPVPDSTKKETIERITIIDHLNDSTETSFVITETRTSVNGGEETLDRKGVMYDARGGESEYNNQSIDPHNCENITDVLFDLWFYYVDGDTIEVNVGFTKKNDSSYEGEDVYYLVENLVVNVDSTVDLVINVVLLDEEGTYGLMINGELVATIGQVNVSATE